MRSINKIISDYKEIHKIKSISFFRIFPEMIDGSKFHTPVEEDNAYRYLMNYAKHKHLILRFDDMVNTGFNEDGHTIIEKAKRIYDIIAKLKNDNNIESFTLSYSVSGYTNDELSAMAILESISNYIFEECFDARCDHVKNIDNDIHVKDIFIRVKNEFNGNLVFKNKIPITIISLYNQAMLILTKTKLKEVN